MTVKLDGTSVAIVTGASRGYGREVARALLWQGWSVVGNGRTVTSLREAEDDLSREGSFEGVSGDIADAAHLRELVRTAESLGSLRLLVNNAGTLGPSPLPAVEAIAELDLLDVLSQNVVAPTRLIQIALPSLRRANPPSVIINVTSDAAAGAYEGWGAYGASKSALEHLGAVLAVEEPELRVYALDPGDMRTEMHQAAFPGEDISDRPQPAAKAPAVVRLAKGDLPSGRYEASDLMPS